MMRLNEPTLGFHPLTEEDLTDHPGLREGIRGIDEGYEQVISKYPAECYQLFLAPYSVDVTEAEGKAIVKTFQCKVDDTGTSEAFVVKLEGNYYRVWVNFTFCG